MAEAHLYLNALPDSEARAELLRCCGSRRWVERMLEEWPFMSSAQLQECAQQVWSSLEESDHLEAYSHHPRIGEDLSLLRQRFASTAAWSGDEQLGVTSAAESTLTALRDANAAYYQKFGFIFIICATGKTADEMLTALNTRLANTRERELAIAAAEQANITRLRLEKLGS